MCIHKVDMEKLSVGEFIFTGNRSTLKINGFKSKFCSAFLRFFKNVAGLKWRNHSDEFRERKSEALWLWVEFQL